MRDILDSSGCSASALQTSCGLDEERSLPPPYFLSLPCQAAWMLQLLPVRVSSSADKKILETIENSAQEFCTRLTSVLIDLCGSLT